MALRLHKYLLRLYHYRSRIDSGRELGQGFFFKYIYIVLVTIGRTVIVGLCRAALVVFE